MAQRRSSRDTQPIVKAQGRDPRLVLDSTICQVNPHNRIPEAAAMPLPACWWQRAGGLITRLAHLAPAFAPHKAWLYVDDLLAALLNKSSGLDLQE